MAMIHAKMSCLKHVCSIINKLAWIFIYWLIEVIKEVLFKIFDCKNEIFADFYLSTEIASTGWKNKQIINL